MKKAKKADKNNMMPDPGAMEGIPSQDPHEDFARKDAKMKKHRGAKS